MTSTVSRKAAWEGLKRLSQDHVTPNHSVADILPWGILKTVGSRDPNEYRAHAIIASSVVEQALVFASLKRFPREDTDVLDQLFEGNGAPLSSFDASIRIAYSLGIIGKDTRDDLSSIRRIRNAFAHTRIKIDFDREEIRNACSQISLPQRWPEMGVDPSDAREVYLQSCFQYSLFLLTEDDGRGDAIKGASSVQLMRT